MRWSYLRRPIIGGNWKMNMGSPEDARNMLKKFVSIVKKIKNVDIFVAAPFTALDSSYQVIKKTNVKLGAQNMYFEEKGAYTGEISPLFIKDIGCEYVILGHSERRDIFNESNLLINKKLKKALSLELKPVVCVGEHLEERESGKTKEIIQTQIIETFKDLSTEEMINIVIAYEPIWAIGTGKTATPEQAEEIHVFIREQLAQQFDEDTASKVRIQYGGSIKPSNAQSLFNKKNIDGGLVGGASLQADSLYEIIQAAENSFQ